MRRSRKAMLLTLVALSVLAVMALVPAVAQAQDHGVAFGKVCVSPVKAGDPMYCVLRVENDDGFNDTITIEDIWDTIGSGSGPVVVNNIPILNIIGNASCAAGPSLPCDIGPDIGGGVGAVEFLQNIYIVQPGDPDPLFDTFTAMVRDNCNDPAGQPTCNPSAVPGGFGSATNLFQPEIAVDKVVDPDMSKVGDTVNYTVTLSNNSSTDTPPLNCIAVDTLEGTLFDDVLPLGDTVVDYSYVIQAGDPDPLVNTVTLTCTFDNLPNVLTVDASSEVNLFEPSITLSKTGDEISKVGDDVSYTITLNNTSSDDTPDLECTISDPMLGVSENVTLASGESQSVNASYTVQAGDADPLVNTATATCSPVGYPNIIDAEASYTVDLFQPSVMVEKEAEAGDCPMEGDMVDYGFTITNTSSPDSPDLSLISVMDSLLGDLTSDASAAGCDTLAPGGSCSFAASRAVQAGDPDPLVNTVTVTYGVVGFPNEVSDDDSASVSLCYPSIELLKTADVLGKIGDEVAFTISVTNTSPAGTPDLTCTITDAMLGVNEVVTLAIGDTHVINKMYMVQPTDPDPLINTVEVVCDPSISAGTQTSQALVELFQPSVSVDKSGPDQAEDGDMVDYMFTITNTSSADSPNLMLVSVMDDLLGDLTGDANSAGCGDMAPGDSCNFSVGRVLLETDPDPLTNTVWVHYHPDGFENDISATDSHSVERPHGVGGVVDFFAGKPGGSGLVNMIATGLGLGIVVVFTVALVGYMLRKRHSEL